MKKNGLDILSGPLDHYHLVGQNRSVQMPRIPIHANAQTDWLFSEAENFLSGEDVTDLHSRLYQCFRGFSTSLKFDR